MLSDKWQNAIASAARKSDVVAVARHFLSSWSPEQIAALPRNCRPGEMNEAEDVADYAFILVSEECAADQSPALKAMASFFAAASTRLSEISAPKDFTWRRPLKP